LHAESDAGCGARSGSDAGTGTVELVLLAPIVVLFVLLVVVLGRIAETGAEVTGAARDAARAASMARTPGSAANAAHTAAASALAGENIDCSTGVSGSPLRARCGFPTSASRCCRGPSG
jgi:Flp pilus assembly protein TadG